MSTTDLPGTVRVRGLVTALPLLVIAGLVSRFALPGPLGDLVGGMLYTGLIYVLVAIAVPRLEPWRVAAAAFGISLAIELAQLTDVPRDLADAFGPARLVFGTSFAAFDLVAYALGTLAALWAERRFAS